MCMLVRDGDNKNFFVVDLVEQPAFALWAINLCPAPSPFKGLLTLPECKVVNF